jgi:hypothetical protein
MRGGLLDPQQAADAMHITWSTFRSYVRYSIPYWTGDEEGRPPIPPSDRESEVTELGGLTQTHRHWHRRTLSEHQARRPGPGNPDGRPSSASGPPDQMSASASSFLIPG